MEKLPITKEQYDTFATRFTVFLFNLVKIKTNNGYLKELNRLKNVAGNYGVSLPPRLLLGGMPFTKKKLRFRTKPITMRRVMQDRIDRQSRRLTVNVMGRRINTDTISRVTAVAILVCMASTFGGVLSPLYPTLMFVVFWVFGNMMPHHHGMALYDARWIERFLKEMDRIEAMPPPLPIQEHHQQSMVRYHSQMNISPLALSSHPSLFPTYARYMQVMQFILRASVTRTEGDGDHQRLCILGMAGMAGIVARRFLGVEMSRVAKTIISDRVRRGTVRRFLRDVDSERAFDEVSEMTHHNYLSDQPHKFYNSRDAPDG